MLSAVSASLAARTGRPLREWAALVQASGIDPLDQNAVRRWLRTEHGVPQNSQWAIADSAARDRVDLGLRFADPPPPGRLQPAKAPGQATHKISLRSVQEVDDEVRHLLRLAYQQSA
jgi:Domain of unknown function (DUF4287)